MSRIESLGADPFPYAEPHPDKAPIFDLVAGCSVASRHDIGLLGESDTDLLPPETRVHICAAPKRSLDGTIATARKLRANGFEPVADIAAGAFASVVSLDGYLARLRGEADVREVLIIGSGSPASARRRLTPLEVLRTGLLDRNGMTRIGIAAYPANWRADGPCSLHETVRTYNAWALGSDARVHFVTQPCCDAEAIVGWEAEAQLAGNLLPIHVGLPGPATPGPPVGLERLCGIGPSSGNAGHDRSHHLLRVALTAPNRMVTTLARHRQQHPDCALAKLHFAAAEGLRGTALWIDAVLRGAFSDRESGESPTLQSFHTAA